MDMPGEAGVRNIKSMWEKGNVQNSPTSPTPALSKTESKVTDGAVWGMGVWGLSGVKGFLWTKAWRKRWSKVQKSGVGKLNTNGERGKKRGLKK